jgi:hypothetical protein
MLVLLHLRSPWHEYLEFTYFFWTVTMDTDVKHRTNWPKNHGPREKFAMFWTVSHRRIHRFRLGTEEFFACFLDEPVRNYNTVLT